MIKQSNSHSCYAACAAMATNTTEKEVFDFCGHDGTKKPFKNLEIFAYLLKKGYIPGIFPSFNHKKLKRGENITVGINFRIPAIITIPSKIYKQYTHAVYWDGKKVYDPQPKNKNHPDLYDLKIIEWYPITDFKDK